MKYGMGLRLAALGPFRIADLGGLDTFDHISQYLFAALIIVRKKILICTASWKMVNWE